MLDSQNYVGKTPWEKQGQQITKDYVEQGSLITKYESANSCLNQSWKADI